MAEVYSIGHSNLSLERFVHALEMFGVTSVVDVRSAPFSRWSPQFNRERLAADLPAAGISYRYAGEALGGRPKDLAMYRHGFIPDDRLEFLEHVDYQRVAEQPWFQLGIQRLLDLAASETVAMMCTEEDPSSCHRQHLIEMAIGDRAVVRHIRTNGGRTRLESKAAMVEQTRLF